MAFITLDYTRKDELLKDNYRILTLSDRMEDEIDR